MVFPKYILLFSANVRIKTLQVFFFFTHYQRHTLFFCIFLVLKYLIGLVSITSIYCYRDMRMYCLRFYHNIA